MTAQVKLLPSERSFAIETGETVLEAALAGGAAGQVLDGAAHEGHRVHVNACFGRAYIDGTAHTLCLCHCHRNGTDQEFIALCHSLGYDCRVSPDKYHKVFYFPHFPSCASPF